MKQLPPFSLADLSIGKWALHYKQAGITFRFFMLLCVAFYLCIGFSLHKLYGIQVICYSSALKTIDITGFFKKFCITTRTSQNPRLSRGLEEALEGLHAGTHLKMHRKIFHLHHSHCCPQVGKVAFTARHSENNF